jgi:RNA polymerase sigma-70 factor (ECF subfamily)
MSESRDFTAIDQVRQYWVTSDEDLMVLAANGQQTAFNKLFERYQVRIYNFIKKQVVAQDAAEDVTQEVFFRLYKSIKSYDPSRQFSSYLYKIAVNEIRRFYQKLAANQTYSLNDPVLDSEDGRERGDLIPGDTSPEIQVSSDLGSESVRKLIDRLPPEQKMVVLLKVYDQMTFDEIARVMDRPLSTVLSRMRYALQKLHNWINEEGIGSDELLGS